MKLLIIFLTCICSNFICIGQTDSAIRTVDTDTLKTQLKLVKVELTPHCGVIAWTAAQKFELLQNGQSLFPRQYIIVLQRCPEFLGKKFFVTNRIYNAILSKAENDNGAINSHRHEGLPTYWCTQIKPA